jgi:hypothetical protein
VQHLELHFESDSTEQATDEELAVHSDSECKPRPAKKEVSEETRHYAELAIAAVLEKYSPTKLYNRPLETVQSVENFEAFCDADPHDTEVKVELDGDELRESLNPPNQQCPLDSETTISIVINEVQNLPETLGAEEDLKATSDDEIYSTPFKKSCHGSVQNPEISDVSSGDRDGRTCQDDALENLWRRQPLSLGFSFNLSEAHTPPKCAVCSIFRTYYGDDAYKLSGKQQRIATKYAMDGFEATRPLMCEYTFSKPTCTPVGLSPEVPSIPIEARKPCPLLVCTSCNLSVHAICYGVSLESFSSEWLCVPCAACEPSAVSPVSHSNFSLAVLCFSVTFKMCLMCFQKCCVCPTEGGALKPVSRGPGCWVHVVCAIALPEATFQDELHKSWVDLSGLSNARKSLRCSICRKQSESHASLGGHRPSNPCAPSDLRTGCAIQCAVKQCTVAFHITCAYLTPGFNIHPGEIEGEPGIRVACKMHGSMVQKRDRNGTMKSRLTSQQNMHKEAFDHDTPLVARHRNNNYYRVQLVDVRSMVHYEILFDDGSYCDNLVPDGVVNRDWRREGHPRGHTRLTVLWKDGLVYGAKFNNLNISYCYTVLFPDSSQATLGSDRVFALNQPLPSSVQRRLLTQSQEDASTSKSAVAI